jgi:S-DNA-T family DNA segregation ATPase FtsK/SpoIIIE
MRWGFFHYAGSAIVPNQEVIMANEYKPTRKVDASAQGDKLDASPDRRPTVPIGDAGAGQHGYGYASPAAQSGALRTERLRVEPPTFAWLVIVDGVHAGHVFQLHPESTLIGRDPSCDIVLDDTAASRQHARVRVVEGEDKQKIFVLHDMATENGTLVNDEEIVKHELSDNDRILIGRTKLVFKQVQA